MRHELSVPFFALTKKVSNLLRMLHLLSLGRLYGLNKWAKSNSLARYHAGYSILGQWDARHSTAFVHNLRSCEVSWNLEK